MTAKTTRMAQPSDTKSACMARREVKGKGNRYMESRRGCTACYATGQTDTQDRKDSKRQPTQKDSKEEDCKTLTHKY